MSVDVPARAGADDDAGTDAVGGADEGTGGGIWADAGAGADAEATGGPDEGPPGADIPWRRRAARYRRRKVSRHGVTESTDAGDEGDDEGDEGKRARRTGGGSLGGPAKAKENEGKREERTIVRGIAASACNLYRRLRTCENHTSGQFVPGACTLEAGAG